MERLAFVLYPFALIYGWVTGLRNWLFDRGILKTQLSPIPSILVGNLSVGGTGKTPMVEYLIRMLTERYQVATLSRGYGRKTKGFLEANAQSTPESIGDEPFQLLEKYGSEVRVFVGEDRVSAAQRIRNLAPSLDRLILDDAFQHRAIRAQVNILLTTFSKPLSRDHLLPLGRLREYRNGAKRADVLVVTKCPPSLSEMEKESLRQELRPFLDEECPILFSKIGYGAPYALIGHEPLPDSVILVSGIASDQELQSHVTENFNLLDRVKFPDHHSYSKADMDRLQDLCQRQFPKKPAVLITEKDANKVKSLVNRGFLGEFPIFVQPIQVQFSPEDESLLRDLISRKIS
ncbi:tetraacyldisaccharide 4'-kinase [Algoriphagus namhaensis]